MIPPSGPFGGPTPGLTPLDTGSTEPRRPRNGWARPAAAAAGVMGIAVLIAGTFLPWVISGQVRRNSYAIAGLVDRLDVTAIGGAGRAVVHLWPFLGPVCLLPVLIGALGWWRSAGVTAILFGLVLGAAATVLLAVTSGHSAMGIALDPVGPAIVLAGSLLLVLAGVALLCVHRPKLIMEPSSRHADDTPAVAG